MSLIALLASVVTLLWERRRDMRLLELQSDAIRGDLDARQRFFTSVSFLHPGFDYAGALVPSLPTPVVVDDEKQPAQAARVAVPEPAAGIDESPDVDVELNPGTASEGLLDEPVDEIVPEVETTELIPG